MYTTKTVVYLRKAGSEVGFERIQIVVRLNGDRSTASVR